MVVDGDLAVVVESDADHVETDIPEAEMTPTAGDPGGCEPSDPALFVGPHGQNRGGGSAAQSLMVGFHLDDHQRPAGEGDQVQLSRPDPPVPGEDPPAPLPEPCCADVLGALSGLTTVVHATKLGPDFGQKGCSSHICCGDDSQDFAL